MSEVMSSKSEINTNMTMVELKGSVVKDLTKLSEGERECAVSTIEKFLISEGSPLYIMLLSNELRYFTTFRFGGMDSADAAEKIINFIETEEFFAQYGELKLVEAEGDHVEVWVGDKFFALFNYDSFIVEV